MVLLGTSSPRKRRSSAVDSNTISFPFSSKKATPNLIGHGHRPRGYWDTLSKIWLTRGSLAEFDRRSSADATTKATPLTHSRYTSSIVEVDRLNIKQFARRGGPDLTKLRGLSMLYPSPDNISRSNDRSRNRHRPSVSGISGNTARSSPYSGGFEQKLTDHGIFMYSQGINPENKDEIHEVLNQRRPSLSPSQFSEDAFHRFVEDDCRTVKESRVISDVVPIIAGSADRHHLSMDNVQLQDLESLADGQITAPTPDRYYGAGLKDIDPRVRQSLAHHIIPSTDKRLPTAPNFFLEVKSMSGRADVAQRQICHDGAVGAHAMHSLQNYNVPEPVYDKKARVITSTYHNDQLKLYTHHIAQPATYGDRPEYHMKPARSFAMTHSSDRFREGAAAYRNARDWAQKQRDALIAEANKRARHGSPDLMPFSSTGHSHNTSATDARHV